MKDWTIREVFNDLKSIKRRVRQVERDLRSIKDDLKILLFALSDLKETIMAVADDLKAGIAQLNNETNAIGDLITALAARIKNGMTDAEVADVKAAFTALDERLKGLAVDPTAPVPPPPPAMQKARQVAGKP